MKDCQTMNCKLTCLAVPWQRSIQVRLLQMSPYAKDLMRRHRKLFGGSCFIRNVMRESSTRKASQPDHSWLPHGKPCQKHDAWKFLNGDHHTKNKFSQYFTMCNGAGNKYDIESTTQYETFPRSSNPLGSTPLEPERRHRGVNKGARQRRLE